MNRATELSIAFLEARPLGAARALERIPPEDAAAFLEEAPEIRTATVLSQMQPARAVAILERASPKKAAAVLSKTTVHARSVLVRALPPSTKDAILAAFSRREAAALRRYLAYDVGTVGAWMDAPKATFAPDTAVKDCLERIRRSGTRLGSLLFVIDEDKRLRGVVDVEGLLGAKDDALLGELMQKNFTRVSPNASLAAVVSLPAWDRALSLPVTDRSRRLVGVLHFDSLRESLLVERGPAEGPRINVLVVHLVQAFLVVLAGLLHTATAAPSLSRLASDGES